VALCLGENLRASLGDVGARGFGMLGRVLLVPCFTHRGFHGRWSGTSPLGRKGWMGGVEQHVGDGEGITALRADGINRRQEQM
jgi:hypothetical protein